MISQCLFLLFPFILHLFAHVGKSSEFNVFFEFLWVFIELCLICFSEYTPGTGSVPDLSVMEARFLRLASDLKLSTSQADGVARYIQQQNH